MHIEIMDKHRAMMDRSVFMYYYGEIQPPYYFKASSQSIHYANKTTYGDYAGWRYLATTLLQISNMSLNPTTVLSPTRVQLKSCKIMPTVMHHDYILQPHH